MGGYDDAGYGQAKGDFIVPPRRTDASDPAFDDGGGAAPGYVIRPEADDDAQGQLPLTPEEERSWSEHIFGAMGDVVARVGDAVGGFAQSVAEKVLPEPKVFGIECRNGVIIQFLGQESVETLAARRQHLLDTRSERSVEVIADAKIYQLMQEYCERLPDDTPVKALELFLSVAEALEKQSLFAKLKLTMGSKRAFVAVMGHLPSPPRPPDNYIIVRQEQYFIVGHGHRFREPAFLVATPWLSEPELAHIFRLGRYVHDAMADYHDLYLSRRDADTLFRHGHRRMAPLPGPTHDEAIAAIYGDSPDGVVDEQKKDPGLFPGSLVSSRLGGLGFRRLNVLRHFQQELVSCVVFLVILLGVFFGRVDVFSQLFRNCLCDRRIVSLGVNAALFPHHFHRHRGGVAFPILVRQLLHNACCRDGGLGLLGRLGRDGFEPLPDQDGVVHYPTFLAAPPLLDLVPMFVALQKTGSS
jgi:hypothetical protein